MSEAKQKRRWMPVVLGLSLALNLAVVAAISGAAWRHKGESGGPRAERSGGPVYVQALSREARRSLREQTRGTSRGASETAAMLAALRAEPFDVRAADSVFDAQRARGLARYDATRTALLAQIEQMTADERAAYADRIEAIAKKRKGKWKKPPKE